MISKAAFSLLLLALCGLHARTVVAACFFAPEFCTCRHSAPSGTCYKSNGDGTCSPGSCQASWKCDCLGPTHMCRRGRCTRFVPIPGANAAPGVDIRCHKIDNATCIESQGTHMGMIGELSGFTAAMAASPSPGSSVASPLTVPSSSPASASSLAPSASASASVSASSSVSASASVAASASASASSSSSAEPSASSSASASMAPSTAPTSSASASAAASSMAFASLVPSMSSTASATPSTSPSASSSISATPSVSTTTSAAVLLSGFGGPCNSIEDCLEPPTPLGIACVLNKCKEIGKCDVEMNTYCSSRQTTHTCCEAVVDCGLYNLEADSALCGRDCTASCTGFNGYQACAFKSGGANLLVSISTAQYQALIPACPVVA